MVKEEMHIQISIPVVLAHLFFPVGLMVKIVLSIP
jgi:hypothetical protein